MHSLTNFLESTSRGRIGGDKAKLIRNLAKKSVGIYVSDKVLELRHTLKLIQILDEEIAAVIEAEIGDFRRFSSPDKILAFAGLSPSTYQFGDSFSDFA